MSDDGFLKRIATSARLLLAPDPMLRAMRAAALGEEIDPDWLAAAYWHGFYATYLPRDAWHALPRSRRRRIYRKRLKIVAAFAALPHGLRVHIAQNRPPPPVQRDVRPPSRGGAVVLQLSSPASPSAGPADGSCAPPSTGGTAPSSAAARQAASDTGSPSSQ